MPGAPHVAREVARRGTRQLEEAAGEGDRLLDEGGRQAGLEVGARLLEDAGHGAKPRLEADQSFRVGHEVAHHEGEQRFDDMVEVEAGQHAMDAAEAVAPQDPPQQGDRDRGTSGVGGGRCVRAALRHHELETLEGALRHRDACVHGRGREGGERVEAVTKAKPGGQDRVVRNELVDQPGDDLLDAHGGVVVGLRASTR